MMEIQNEPPRWTVHVRYLDGIEEEVSGDPEVEGDVLIVRVQRPHGNREILFEAGYPLRHVRTWWVDYLHDDMPDAARSGPSAEGGE